MSAYMPSEAWVVIVLIATVAVVIVAGHAMARRCSTVIARSLAWTSLLVGTFGVDRLIDREPSGIRMVALILFALLVMKVIVVIEERARGMEPLTFGVWLSFAAAWPGMRPRLFTSTKTEPLPGAGALIRRGALHVVLGAVLVALARLAWAGTQSRFLATVLVLPGLSFLLHFGFFNLLAGTWRRRGIACGALFRAPLRSQNLGEFWARRWNLAFSEMTAIAAYRPLAKRLGRGPSLMAGFALSGLLHEMAISLPVRAGFGLPLLYFLVQGALVLFEHALSNAGHTLKGPVGRVWALFWLAVPLPLLFHRPFLAGVVWPLIGICPSD